MNIFKKLLLIYILFFIIFSAYQINTEISYIYTGTHWVLEIILFFIIPSYLGYKIGEKEE